MTDQERLTEAIRRDFPRIEPSTDTAWRRQPALRVIDCVLSLNRNYDRFLVPRLDAFERRHPHLTAVSQLHHAIRSYSSPEEFVAQELDYRDPRRAQVLAEVTTYLVRVISEADTSSELAALENWSQSKQPSDHRVGISGFGLAGFQYLRMLFGANTAKPDVHIIRYVARSVGRELNSVQALTLIEEVAQQLGIDARDLDTNIWERSARSS
jgi:hypothetical protein